MPVFDAEEGFYLRTRNSIRGFVRPSVGPLVRWSVGLLVQGHRVEKWKNERFRYFLCVFAHPSATILWHRVFCWAHCSCPNALGTFSITAPAHLHTTGVAVYPALFT